MISIYTTAFNIEKNNFNIDSAINNFLKLGNELCIATIPDNEDDTISILKNISNNNKNIKICIDKNINSNSFAKDGKLKNLSLQNCSNNICVQLDLDERISNETIWRNFINTNQEMILKGYAFMVPVLNLYKDKYHYKNIGTKWYIHKKDGMYRGIVNFAKLSNEKFDKDKSDGCELIDLEGNLIPSINILDHPSIKNIPTIEILKHAQLPYVIHYGYVDLSRRCHINKNFWEKEWSEYSGKKVKLNTEEHEFTDDFFKHGIEI